MSNRSDPKRLYSEEGSQGPSSERQPLHENFSDNEGIEESNNVPNSRDVSNLIENHPQLPDEPKDNVRSYHIEPSFQSTAENPYQETTVTVPRLVRRVPSSDLVPKGWKSINRLLIASYVSVLCFVFTGIFANRYAWRAKRHQSKGLYGLVKRDSRRSAILIYASFGLGILTVILVTVLVVTQKDEP